MNSKMDLKKDTNNASKQDKDHSFCGDQLNAVEQVRAQKQVE